MKFHILEPDVAISIGPNSIMDTTIHPPKVERLHIIMEGWFGDEILESFPCFVFSEKLAKAIEEKQFTGITFNDLEFSEGDQFRMSFPHVNLPKFVWGIIDGLKQKDDFFIDENFVLVVSEKALSTIKQHNHTRLSIEKKLQAQKSFFGKIFSA